MWRRGVVRRVLTVLAGVVNEDLATALCGRGE